MKRTTVPDAAAPRSPDALAAAVAVAVRISEYVACRDTMGWLRPISTHAVCSTFDPSTATEASVTAFFQSVVELYAWRTCCVCTQYVTRGDGDYCSNVCKTGSLECDECHRHVVAVHAVANDAGKVTCDACAGTAERADITHTEPVDPDDTLVAVATAGAKLPSIRRGDFSPELERLTTRVEQAFYVVQCRYGFFASTCTECHNRYWRPGRRTVIHSNGYDKCLKCFRADLRARREMTHQCTHCGDVHRPSELAKCELGDCALCVACRIDCDKCEAADEPLQCPRTKECRGGGFEPKRGFPQLRRCPKGCDQMRQMYNSHGSNIARRGNKPCTHGWCHICEKHNVGHYNGDGLCTGYH